MTATTKIECDNCGTDLTKTDSIVPRYRTVLSMEGMPTTANARAMVQITPAVQHAHHFCDFGCLQSWLSKRNAK